MRPRESSRRPLPLPSRLLFIADAGHAPDPAELVTSAIDAGVRFVEIRRVRRADGSPESGLRLAEIVRSMRAAGSACVIVNDRVDLAVLAGAGGAHVGQDDLAPVAARRLLGPGALLGLSTHGIEQVNQSQREPVDYIAIGPVFASSTKSGHAEPLGLDLLADCCDASRLPVVAIGGIDLSNVAGVLDAGAAAAAVAGAISRGDAISNAGSLLAAVDAHCPPRRHPAGAEALLLAGPPGAGKTTVGRLLASRLDVPFHDLDAVVAGGEVVGSLVGRVGEARFRELEAEALSGLLARARGRCVVSLGGGTPRGARSRVLIRRTGALVIELVVPPAEALRRVEGQYGARPLLDAARSGGTGALEAHFRDRAVGVPDLRLDALPAPEEIVRRILAGLPAGLS